MHILASSPELQAVRFGYVILGENGKKSSDPLEIGVKGCDGFLRGLSLSPSRPEET
jgi:hypothetical protein